MKKLPDKTDEFAIKPAINQSNFIQAEVNLEKLPFFFPDKRKRSDIASLTITYTKEIVANNQAISLEWKVMGTPEYGIPNYFDRDVYRCIQRIITEKGVKEDGYICFSSKEILNLLGYTNSGKDKKRIKESIERMVATTIRSEGAFYTKEKKEKISKTFHLFEDFIYKNQKLGGGIIADTNYLKINPTILESMVSGYVKPVDFDYYISLKNPSAKALYSKLSLDFYGLPDNVACLTKRYSELCKETLITYQQYPSQAKNYLKKALDELISTKFLAKVEFKPMPNNLHDFYINFYPGERAKDQYKFKNVLLPEIEVFEPLKIVENKNGKGFQSPIINDVLEAVKDQLSEEALFLINSLIKLGMSEDKAKQCATEHKEKTSYWLKAKDHYSKSSSIRNTPAFIYKAITSNWVSTPYEEYLKKQELKQLQQEEEHKKGEEDKKLLQSSAKEWEEWTNLTNVIESLDVNLKQELYNFVKKENKGHILFSRLEVNQPLVVRTLTGLKDSFIRGIKTLNIDVKGFKHLLD